MKTNTAKFLPIAEKFFTAYDAHDVDGMLALCADGAIGRYAPYVARACAIRVALTSFGVHFRMPCRIFE